MPKITPPRLKLLRGLENCVGGCLPAEFLAVPVRRLATQMQRDGLVRWKVNGGLGSRHTLKGQTLYITVAGRAIVKSYADH